MKRHKSFCCSCLCGFWPMSSALFHFLSLDVNEIANSIIIKRALLPPVSRCFWPSQPKEPQLAHFRLHSSTCTALYGLYYLFWTPRYPSLLVYYFFISIVETVVHPWKLSVSANCFKENVSHSVHQAVRSCPVVSWFDFLVMLSCFLNSAFCCGHQT